MYHLLAKRLTWRERTTWKEKHLEGIKVSIHPCCLVINRKRKLRKFIELWSARKKRKKKRQNERNRVVIIKSEVHLSKFTIFLWFDDFTGEPWTLQTSFSVLLNFFRETAWKHSQKKIPNSSLLFVKCQ